MKMLTKNFSRQEMGCKCGKCDGSENMDSKFMEKLQNLRDKWGGPLTITSAYRCVMHPNEIAKDKPGAHAQGTAADIAVSSGFERYQLILIALSLGFSGVGIHKDFIHLDTGNYNAKRPALWLY